MFELTEYQQIPLFKLVEFQKKLNAEVIFSISGSCSCQIQEFESSFSDNPITLFEIPKEILEIWDSNNFIHISNRSIGFSNYQYNKTTFILRKEAFNYSKFMKHHSIIRFFIQLWNKLIDDMPSLIWGAIGGALAVIITKILGY